MSKSQEQDTLPPQYQIQNIPCDGIFHICGIDPFRRLVTAGFLVGSSHFFHGCAQMDNRPPLNPSAESHEQ